MIRSNIPLFVLSCFIFLAMLVLPGYAQTSYISDIPLSEQFGIRVYTEKDGLPQSSITTFALDKKGYLWIGTQNGAAYYNGRRWTIVNLPNHTNSNYVRSICPASDGSIWFGTNGAGISVLKDGKWTTYDTNSGLSNNQIRSVVEITSPDGINSIWVGTYGSGLSCYQNNQWNTFDTSNSELPNDLVRVLTKTIEPDGTQSLWIGTYGGGIVRLHKNKWTIFDTKSGLPNNQISVLLGTVADNSMPILWAAMSGGKIARFENNIWTLVDTGFVVGDVTSMIETKGSYSSSTIWIGTSAAGLVFLKDNKWSIFNTSSGLSNNSLSSLFVTATSDGLQILWVGTTNSGITRLEPKQWMEFKLPEECLNRNIRCVLETKSLTGSALWFGTWGSGLWQFSQGKWTLFNIQSGLPDNHITALLETSDFNGVKTLWVGTLGGIARLQNNQWTSFNTNSGLPNNQITSLLVTSLDGKQSVWAGTLNGLAFWEQDKWVSVSIKINTPNLTVNCLAKTEGLDGRSILWVGTNGGGLLKFDHGRWNTYDINSGLTSSIILSLLEITEENGTQALWVATQNEGIFSLNLSSKATKLTALPSAIQSQLPSNSILQMCSGSKKQIYIFTTNGAACLNRLANNNDYAVQCFTVENGLPNNKCNRGASTIDSQEHIWIGTVDGVAHFNLINTNNVTPSPLHVEQFLLDGDKTIDLQNRSLAYDENNLTIKFALLSYFRESNTNYKVQLEGFDTESSEWMNFNEKKYIKLPNGSYVFKVWGRDYAGNISGPISIQFTIKAAPWRTWWAYLIYIIILASAAWIGVQYRRQLMYNAEAVAQRKQLEETNLKLKELDKIKTNFIAMLVHDLKSPLSVVKTTLQLFTTDQSLSNSSLLPLIKTSGRSLDKIISLIDEVLEVFRSESQELKLRRVPIDPEPLLRECVEEARLSALSNKINVQSKIESKLPLISADSGKLNRVFSNLLSNAIKFTSTGGNITIEAFTADGNGVDEGTKMLIVTITDTGEGIASEEVAHVFDPYKQAESSKVSEGFGLGLAIVKRIVVAHGGNISIQSQVGVGSSFTITLPTLSKSN